MAQHQRRRQNQRAGVDDVLAGILGRGAMHRLEDRDLSADIGRRREAKPTDQCRGEVAEDITIHVCRHDDIELLWALYELMRAVVYDDVFGLDLGVLRRDLLE